MSAFCNQLNIPLLAAISIVSPAFSLHAEPVKKEEKTCEEMCADYLTAFKKQVQLAEGVKDEASADKALPAMRKLLLEMKTLDSKMRKSKPVSQELMKKNMEAYLKYMRDIRERVLRMDEQVARDDYYGFEEIEEVFSQMRHDVNQVRLRELSGEVQEFTMNYYSKPQPGKVSEFMKKEKELLALSSNPGMQASSIGFYSEIFKKNPDRLEGWVKEISAFPGIARATLITALWQANTPEAIKELREYAKWDFLFTAKANNPNEGLHKLKELQNTKDPAELDMAWGAFFASGDKGYIESLVRCAVRPMPEDLKDEEDICSDAARWSLKAMAAQDNKVKAILDAAVKKLSPEQKKTFEAQPEKDEPFKEYSTTA